MINFNGLSLEEDILETKFSCDLKNCKGACCTFPGDFGAPLLDHEIERIREILPAAFDYLSETSKEYIRRRGFYEGVPGAYTTMCINRRDCVFVFYEGDVAKCAIEAAYFSGAIKFRKPISCHLFPIRVRNFGTEYVYYEKIDECKPALIKGENEGISLLESLKEAIVRAYGEDFYEGLMKLNKTKKLPDKTK